MKRTDLFRYLQRYQKQQKQGAAAKLIFSPEKLLLLDFQSRFLVEAVNVFKEHLIGVKKVHLREDMAEITSRVMSVVSFKDVTELLMVSWL